MTAVAAELARRTPVLKQVLYLSGVLSLAVNSVLLWPILGRFAPVALTGQLATGLAAIGLISPAFSLGLHVTLLRDISGPDPSNKNSAVFVARLSTQAYSVAGVFACLILAPFAASTGALIFSSLATAAIFVALASVRARDCPWLFAILSSVSQTVGPAVAGLVLVLTNSSTWAFSTLGVVLSISAVLAVSWGAPATGTGVPLRQLQAAVSRSIMLVPHLILTVVILQGVRLLVAWRDGYEQAAVLQFALILGGLPITTVLALGGYWSANAYRSKTWDEFRDYCRRYGDRLLLVAGILNVCVFASAMFLLDSWLPPSIPRAQVAQTAVLVAPAAGLQVLADLQSTRALRSGHSGLLSIATGFGAIVTGLGVLILGTSKGLQGVALSLSLGILARICVSSLLLRRVGVPFDMTKTAGFLISSLFTLALILSFS